jgi:hypothetical protein
MGLSISKYKNQIDTYRFVYDLQNYILPYF